MSDSKLVYSTDPLRNRKCPKCRNLAPECTCENSVSIPTQTFTVVLSLEKTGRGGKTVTVLDGFPKHETYLSQLTKKFKTRCGAGGTYILKSNRARIEIQGDHRPVLRQLLRQEGISFKG